MPTTWLWALFVIAVVAIVAAVALALQGIGVTKRPAGAEPEPTKGRLP